MKKDRAIEILNALWRSKETCYSEKEIRAAIEKAVEALKEECEDAISRKAVLVGLATIANTEAMSSAQMVLMGKTMFFVKGLPAVKPNKEGIL